MQLLIIVHGDFLFFIETSVTKIFISSISSQSDAVGLWICLIGHNTNFYLSTFIFAFNVAVELGIFRVSKAMVFIYHHMCAFNKEEEDDDDEGPQATLKSLRKENFMNLNFHLTLPAASFSHRQFSSTRKVSDSTPQLNCFWRCFPAL